MNDDLALLLRMFLKRIFFAFTRLFGWLVQIMQFIADPQA
jgi:hypothetical protein